MSNSDNSQFNIEYISTSGVYKTPFTLIILLQYESVVQMNVRYYIIVFFMYLDRKLHE